MLIELVKNNFTSSIVCTKYNSLQYSKNMAHDKQINNLFYFKYSFSKHNTYNVLMLKKAGCNITGKSRIKLIF